MVYGKVVRRIEYTNREKIVLSNQTMNHIHLHEDDSCLDARFLICDFAPNRNDVMLNRATIGNWLDTIINQPVVGKITVNDNGHCDFDGHNYQQGKRVDVTGQAYDTDYFDTAAVGVFFHAAIEMLNGKECIVAHAKLWKRFPQFCALLKRRFDEGRLFTSWEIIVKESHWEQYEGRMVKVIDDGIFIGHALLNEKYTPAYRDSQLLEVATEYVDAQRELYSAIILDMESHVSQKEEVDLNAENTNVADETVTEETIATDEGQKSVKIASTETLKRLMAESYGVGIHEINVIYFSEEDKEIWASTLSDKDFKNVSVVKYQENGDSISIADVSFLSLVTPINNINNMVAEKDAKIAELNEALTNASNAINDLNTQIVDLSHYKDKFEQVERERIEKELQDQRTQLSSYAVKSGYITKDELKANDAIRGLIEKVDRNGINAIIAERFMSEIDKKADAECAEKKTGAKANIVDDERRMKETFIQRYIGGNN